MYRGETVPFYVGTMQSGGDPELELELLSGPGQVRVEGLDAYFDAGDELGLARVRLTARVDGGSDSASTQVEVINASPEVRFVQPERVALVGTPVPLQAQASDREDGDSVRYFFEVVSGSGSLEQDAQSAQASFTPDAGGSMTLRVTVTDSDGASASDEAQFYVDGSPPPTVAAQAEATSLRLGESVSLMASVTPDGSDYFYEWALLEGPGSLSGGLSNQQTFHAGTTGAGVALVQLTVTDFTDRTFTDTIEIEVRMNADPVAADIATGADTDRDTQIDWVVASGVVDDDVAELTASVSTDGLQGSFVVSGETLTYQPGASFSGTDTGVLRIEDGLGGSTSIDLTVTARWWTQIAARNLGGYGVKSDGSLWAWGSNAEGELGQGTTGAAVPVAVRVGTDSDWSAVHAGGNMALALKEDGSLWGWGSNDFGGVGVGTTSDVLRPTQIGEDTSWSAAAVGRFHALAIKEDGSLWAWGHNDRGQLCLGDEQDRLAPTRVGMDSDWAQAGAGHHHSVLLRDDGSLWSCGGNDSGQLGDGNRTLTGIEDHDVSLPVAVASAESFDSLSVGWYHTLALSGTSAYGWGKNVSGQLGQGDEQSVYTTPQVIAGSWQQLAAGFDASLGIQSDGTLHAWGYNIHAQLGLGDETVMGEVPPGSGNLQVTSDANRSAPEQVGVADDWSQVITASGWGGGLRGVRRHGWGTNELGEPGLGSGLANTVLTPQGE